MKKMPKLQNRKNAAASKLIQNSTILNLKKFQKKADALSQYCTENQIFDAVRKNGSELPCPFAVFFSIGNPTTRAVVRVGIGATPEEAWEKAKEKTEKFLAATPFAVSYVKADFVDEADWFPLETVNEILKNARINSWRCGIAFDPSFQVAFLEEEQNAQRLVRYDANGISLQRINACLVAQNRPQMFRLPDDVLVFSCQAVFSDADEKIYSLCDEGYSYGRRKLEQIDRPLLTQLLSTSGESLANLLEANGRFRYGYFADWNKKLSGYNIPRHAGAIWALLMQYQAAPQEELRKKIDAALQFLCTEALSEKETSAYLVEKGKNEIKLGANAVAVITWITYMEIMQEETYLPLVKKLGEGILACQNADGSYWHILSYPEWNRTESYRTVYYDGEATFALAKLYGYTKEEKWLSAAQKAVEYFIRQDYTKYRDHWVAYSINEVTKYIPDERYFAFALKNITDNLSFIYQRDTSYHTFLELLMASYETLLRMKQVCPQMQELQTFDEKYLVTAIYYRAQHMLFSYAYPEYAMYLKNPKPFLGTFLIRHDYFRVRIDDIQHFIGGYYHMLQHFDALEEARHRLGISPRDYMQLLPQYTGEEENHV